jgi:hypothetical protein
MTDATTPTPPAAAFDPAFVRKRKIAPETEGFRAIRAGEATGWIPAMLADLGVDG